MVKGKLVPPDGGYGWIIVCACGFYYFITLPIEKGFGLVFNEAFRELQFSATSTSLIINTNSAISMFVGVLVAPLLKKLGYRIVALIASALIVTGVWLTAHASSFGQYIMAYSFITALGYGMGVQAYTLAQNSYFSEKRTKAMGFMLTISGIGPVIMPQIISALMEAYGVKGAVTIVAAIATHTVISGLLLQPIEWHMRIKTVDDSRELEDTELLEKGFQDGSIISRRTSIVPRTMIVMNMEQGRCETTSNYEKKLAKKIIGISDSNAQDVQHEKLVFLAGTKDLLGEESKSTQLPPSIRKRLVNVFDLTLLKDLTFVNTMIGLSLAVYSELNFSLLTPFIMRDFGLTTQEIATFMSLVSAAEICFRFITPYINDYFGKSTRVMFIWSLIFLIISRFSLLLTSNYFGLLFCGFILGTCKGFRTVYWSLVIPNSVPIERLAAASGLQYTFNSFLIWTGGPFLGFVKDVTGSYVNCIFVINFVTLLTIILWSMEFTYTRYRTKRKLIRQ